MPNEPITIIATVRKVNTGGFLKGSPQEFGKITSKCLSSLIGHDVRLTIEDLGLTKGKYYLRKPTALDVTIDYLDELQDEGVNHTELFNRIYEETGKTMKDDEMQTLIEEAKKIIESWRIER